MKSFFLITLGCSKNQVDSESVTHQLKDLNISEIDNPEDADLLIVNTCGFITPAKEESIETILKLAEIKSAKKNKKLIVIGCFAQRNSKELKESIPEIDAIFGINCEKQIKNLINENGIFVEKKFHKYSPQIGHTKINNNKSAYIKISEGCNNLCTYCAIPLIRGPLRTRNSNDIINEATILAKQGVLEINLISQDTALYYDPNDTKYTIINLLNDLEKINGIKWIRLLYLHPAHLTDELIKKMTSNGKILPYFDIPVQHLVDQILKNMNRKMSYSEIKSLIEKIRKETDELTIRTSIITGFPGETDKDFKKLITRIKEIEFDKLGCFMYSEEERTQAVNLKNKIKLKTAGKRLETIMKIQKSISEKKLSTFLNKNLDVLIEEKVEGEDELYIGRSKYDAPDIDGAVVIKNKTNIKNIVGKILKVNILKTMEYDMYGEII